MCKYHHIAIIVAMRIFCSAFVASVSESGHGLLVIPLCFFSKWDTWDDDPQRTDTCSGRSHQHRISDSFEDVLDGAQLAQSVHTEWDFRVAESPTANSDNLLYFAAKIVPGSETAGLLIRAWHETWSWAGWHSAMLNLSVWNATHAGELHVVLQYFHVRMPSDRDPQVNGR